jgi:hypothetical protein
MSNPVHGKEKWIIKNVKALVGDFRDWEMITNWAISVRDALL